MSKFSKAWMHFCTSRTETRKCVRATSNLFKKNGECYFALWSQSTTYRAPNILSTATGWNRTA